MKRTALGTPISAEHLSILRYVIVGSVSFTVYFAVGVLPAYLMNVRASVATGIAVLLAGVVNFLGHYYFTFRSTRSAPSSLLRYIALLGTNAVLGAVLMELSYRVLGLSLGASNVITLVAITAWSYLMMKRVVM